MKNKTQLDEYKTYKSFDGIDLSTIPGTASEILTTNFAKFNDCKSADDVIALCHELLDGKLDTTWTNKFFYNLDQIVQRNPNPRKAYEQTLLYVNNARMKGMGLGMKSRKFYEGEEINESMSDDAAKEFIAKLKDGEVKFEYAKKDGSTRKTTGTLNPDLMNLKKKVTSDEIDKASDKQKKAHKLPADSIFYYDIDSKGFRSFKMSNFVKYL